MPGVNASDPACERCGAALADTVQGFCARCLLQVALDEGLHSEPEEQGRSIGPYRLIRTLGEGGMGVVYFAEEQEPLRRPVALKVIKPGMDSRAVVARFAAESQALALMSHPSVAQVYAAGLTEGGLPYFAMEYVPGNSLTEYCDSIPLRTMERLALFSEVCAAVHHAHERDIVHRDLKPSNVLVTMIDGRAVPKVIDFGVAKAMTRVSDGHTLVTEHGTLLGTPEYMSPEQISSAGTDVDRRTDVYSLGVLLYELLTGMRPFDSATMRAGVDERLRIIRDLDAVPPSRRIKQAGAVAQEIALRRRTTTAALKRELRDLDWIVLKALEKDRALRYQSVDELQADVRRAMRHEPVATRPPTLRYRARKFMRRHRLGVAAAVVAGASIGVGFTARSLISREPSPTVIDWNAASIDLRVLTHTGFSWGPTISHDGSKVVFSQVERRRFALAQHTMWLADVPHGSSGALPIPAAYLLDPLHWSRDGVYLYYLEQPLPLQPRRLQRFSFSDLQIDTLQTSADMPEWLVISPDEQRIAGVRTDKQRALSLLVVMNLDGSEERTIATRSATDPYFLPAWSPDGSSLACSVGHLGMIGAPMRVVTVDVATGGERSVGNQLWVKALAKAWLPDGRALLMLGRRWGEPNDALWRLDLQTNALRFIPTGPDALSDWGFSLTGNGQTMAATRSAFDATMWLVDLNDVGGAKEVGAARGHPRFLPDGRVMFTSANHTTVYKRPGGLEEHLLDGQNAVSTADGRVLVFTREQDGARQVWRAFSKGEQPVQVTRGPPTHDVAEVSPDGQWVVYVTAHDGALWKVPLAGGTAVRMGQGTARSPAISPDGQWVAVPVRAHPRALWKPILFSLSGSVPPREIPMPVQVDVLSVQFSRDGSALDVALHENGVGNVWRLPFGGGAPVQLTRFAADRLQSFDWSWDGKSLICLRGGWRGDIVLLRGDW